eukprot:5759298-Alexandrium_andersonii.AAC.1
MSASLVGSEMCIRDSRNSQRLTKTLRQSRRLTETHRNSQKLAKAHRAVSYARLTLPTICSV